MKRETFFLVLVAAVIGYAVYDHAKPVAASVEPTPVMAVAPVVENGPVVRWTLTAVLNHFKITPEMVNRIQGVVAKADEVFFRPLSKLDAKQLEALQVAAPAPASAYTEVINELQKANDFHDEQHKVQGAELSRLEIMIIKQGERITELEARKECNCPKVVAAPAPVKAPAAPVTYRQECQNGVCRLVPVTQVQQPQTQYIQECVECQQQTRNRRGGGWYLGKAFGR